MQNKPEFKFLTPPSRKYIVMNETTNEWLSPVNIMQQLTDIFSSVNFAVNTSQFQGANCLTVMGNKHDVRFINHLVRYIGSKWLVEKVYLDLSKDIPSGSLYFAFGPRDSDHVRYFGPAVNVDNAIATVEAMSNKTDDDNSLRYFLSVTASQPLAAVIDTYESILGPHAVKRRRDSLPNETRAITDLRHISKCDELINAISKNIFEMIVSSKYREYVGVDAYGRNWLDIIITAGSAQVSGGLAKHIADAVRASGKWNSVRIITSFRLDPNQIAASVHKLDKLQHAPADLTNYIIGTVNCMRNNSPAAILPVLTLFELPDLNDITTTPPARAEQVKITPHVAEMLSDLAFSRINNSGDYDDVNTVHFGRQATKYISVKYNKQVSELAALVSCDNDMKQAFICLHGTFTVMREDVNQFICTLLGMELQSYQDVHYTI